MRRVVAGVCAMLAVAAWSAPAYADDEEDARAAMMRGIAAFGRGQGEAALAEYETAKKLAPKANAPYRYAAEALVSLGRYREAVENLEAYLSKNAAVSDAAEVREKIAKIKADFYPARLRIDVDAPDATVRIDDEAKGPPGVVEIKPGKHRVDVHAPGRAPATQEVELVGDRDATLVFTLKPEEAPPIAPPIVTPIATYESTPWPTIGWIGVGVGSAVLVTGLILDVAVLGPKVDDYNNAVAKGDASAARELHDSASSLQTTTLLTYIVGGVLAGGGAAVVLFAPKQSLRGSTVLPAVGPGYAGLMTQMRF